MTQTETNKFLDQINKAFSEPPRQIGLTGEPGQGARGPTQ